MLRLTSFLFLFSVASIGILGTSGFTAEQLLIVSAINTHLSLGAAALLGRFLAQPICCPLSAELFLD